MPIICIIFIFEISIFFYGHVYVAKRALQHPCISATPTSSTFTKLSLACLLSILVSFESQCLIYSISNNWLLLLMTQRPIRSSKPSRIVRENLENSTNDDTLDELNSSEVTYQSPSPSPTPSGDTPASQSQGPVTALIEGSVTWARIASSRIPAASAVARMLQEIASSNY